MTTTTWHHRVAECAARLADWRFTSEWKPVTQRAITMFAESTEDPDPYHVDPEWSAAHTPYGGTIAQGLWTTAMLVRMLHDSGVTERVIRELEAPIGLNYGFDRLRFIEPVRVGRAVRGHLAFDEMRANGDHAAVLRMKAEMEVEGAARPALAGTWLVAFARENVPMRST
jgi:acyl dehydratase